VRLIRRPTFSAESLANPSPTFSTWNRRHRVLAIQSINNLEKDYLMLASFCRIVIPVLVYVTCVPISARAEILGFGDFSRFSTQQWDAKSPSLLFPNANPLLSKIELTNDATNEWRSIFANTAQGISKFTASFTYQEIGGHADSSNAVGVAFVIQNSSGGARPPLGPVGGNGGVLGYGYAGDAPSLAVTLELGTPPASGLFTDGFVGGGSPPTAPVNLLSGDPINVTLAYDGGMTISESIVDGATSYSAILTLPSDLPTLLGSPTAFVGFTAGAYDFQFDQQYVSNFTFTSVPEPSSLILGTVGAVALLALGLCHRPCCPTTSIRRHAT
jgi:hypothetical protein